MPAPPSFDPTRRDPGQITPADSYQRNEPVWIYRNGSWHTGVVNGTSPFHLMVTYHQVGGRGTVVDTVAPEYVVRHTNAPPAGDAPPAGGDQ
jgi:hypothetical protein